VALAAQEARVFPEEAAVPEEAGALAALAVQAAVEAVVSVAVDAEAGAAEARRTAAHRLEMPAETGAINTTVISR